MDSEQAKKIIMEQFLKDSLLYKNENYTCYGFNTVLSQSIRQYTPNCWESIVIADDSVAEDNVRVCQYEMNEGQIEYEEIRLNPEGIEALKTALNFYGNTENKLIDLSKRAMRRKKALNETPSMEDAEIINKNFNDLEHEVYSCIRKSGKDISMN